MSDHTPGPWVCDAGGTIRGENGWYVARTSGGQNSAADGRLIAAAPKMLKALKGVSTWAKTCGLVDIEIPELDFVDECIAEAQEQKD